MFCLILILVSGASIVKSPQVKSPEVSLQNYDKSCQVILQSGKSKGNGEYSIDPENTGRPIKVYCDMTTAGGNSGTPEPPLEHPPIILKIKSKKYILKYIRK